MNEINPYAPPESDLALPPAADLPPPLAARGSRLGAAIIDGIIIQAIIIPIRYFSGAYLTTTTAGGAQNYTFPSTFAWTTLGLLLWLLLNWTLLDNGQTIGKRLLKLQIQRRDGSRISRLRILTRRAMPADFIQFIPIIGGILPLVDVLFIFGSDRSTLHDYLADSKVVQLPACAPQSPASASATIRAAPATTSLRIFASGSGFVSCLK